MRVFRILICLVACFSGVFGAAAQSVAGNGAYSAGFSDLFSFLNNPASLASVQRAGVGVYVENKFGLKELNKYFLTGIYEGIGAVMAYEGDRDYNHSQAGLAYGKSLGKVNVGVRFNYNMVRMAGYGKVGTIGIELGSIWKITEKFFSGIRVSHPAVYSMGAGYEISEQVFISASIIKEENKVINVQAGLQYIVDTAYYLSIGICSATASPWIVVGWQKKAMRISLAGSMHPQLGVTTSLGIQFFGKKKNDDL